MRSNEGRAGFIAPLAVAALMPWPLLLGPNNWWAFVLASAAIAAALRLLFGREWTDAAGLKVPPAHIFIAAVTFVAVAMGSKMLLAIVYASAGLKAKAPAITAQFGFLFQAFNEEILFRALLIGLLLRYVRAPFLISLGLAALFSAAHFALYRFSNPMHLALSINALATLFLAGVAWNNLYLAFRHVGFSWALHAGWNVVWLPATIYDAATHDVLHEPQMFERVLGAPSIVAVTSAMALFSFGFLMRRPVAAAAKL